MKRILLAGLTVSVLLAGVALWARQQSTPAAPEAARIERRVEAYLRNYYAWSPVFQVKVDPPGPSPIPDVYKVPVVVTYKGQADHAVVYVTHDGRYMIRGSLDDLLANPFAAARTKLEAAIDGHPYAGPANACVNVVEFSDYECPHCADAHEVLKQVEAHFPQVRFTFMDFPLSQIHPWALNAALAARCAFHENPADFLKLRDEIFENQDKITPDNATASLDSLSTQAGLNSTTLQACMATPAMHKEVEDDLVLGKSIGVDSTPTIYVNGRPMVGGNAPLLDQFITYELGQCKPKPASK